MDERYINYRVFAALTDKVEALTKYANTLAKYANTLAKDQADIMERLDVLEKQGKANGKPECLQVSMQRSYIKTR
ncbi:hypothetical protein [Parabacteroides hominis]|uniref:Uncharacterized protein n=1 Tax=Parabacteroides hominis TaxID=2763057 RepID=A0ABR7DMF5_9BACT|nr:hypothetical protein [Parabacteroides hominis]MBC5632614.1 hypothetical protein [Parabacteroides hominis]